MHTMIDPLQAAAIFFSQMKTALGVFVKMVQNQSQLVSLCQESSQFRN